MNKFWLLQWGLRRLGCLAETHQKAMQMRGIGGRDGIYFHAQSAPRTGVLDDGFSTNLAFLNKKMQV